MLSMPNHILRSNYSEIYILVLGMYRPTSIGRILPAAALSVCSMLQHYNMAAFPRVSSRNLRLLGPSWAWRDTGHSWHVSAKLALHFG